MKKFQKDTFNGEISVEITPPRGMGETLCYRLEVDRKEFLEYLQPIHINKNPFVDDNVEEIERIKAKRLFFVNLIKERISDSFDFFFRKRDTINGEPIQ